MPVKHYGKASQEREQRDNSNAKFVRLYVWIAAITLIVSLAIAFFQQ